MDEQLVSTIHGRYQKYFVEWKDKPRSIDYTSMDYIDRTSQIEMPLQITFDILEQHHSLNLSKVNSFGFFFLLMVSEVNSS